MTFTRRLLVQAGATALSSLQGGVRRLHHAAQSRRRVQMRGPNQDILNDERPPGGLLVPKPHNDVAPTPGQPTALAPKEVLGLLLVTLGLFLTVIWVGVLGWLAVELSVWLLR